MPGEKIEISLVQTSKAAQVNCDRSILNTSPQHSYVPFLSKANRFYTQTPTRHPPIGAYDLPSCFKPHQQPLQNRMSHYLIDAQKKQQQMGVFKSTQVRFEKNNNTTPAPTSYNIFKKDHSFHQSRLQHQRRGSQLRQSSVEHKQNYPSIPKKSNKYGYKQEKGQLKEIVKNDKQIEREKQLCKRYVSSLEGERKRTGHANRLSKDGQGSKIMVKASKLIQRASDVSPNLAHSKSQILVKKPKHQHLYQSKPSDADHGPELGPGQYNLRSSFTPSQPSQKYQFFGSSEVRFKRQKLPEKSYPLLQLVKQRNKNLILGRPPKKQGIRSQTSKENHRSDVKPGPGYYDPKDQIAKQGRGTTFFPAEERFKSIKQEEPKNDLGDHGIVLRNHENSLHQRPQKEGKKASARIVKGTQGYRSGGLNKVQEQNKLESERFNSQEISSWSRGETRNKNYKRMLKEQMQMLSDTPRNDLQLRNNYE